MTSRVLLIDDDKEVRDALGQTLELADLTPVLAGSFVAAKDHITPQFDGVIVTDVRMPGRDGFHLLGYAQEQDAALPVILLTGEADVPLAVKAMSEGAFAFLEKPCAPQALLEQVQAALGQREAVLQARAEKLKLESGDAAARMLFGSSPQAGSLRDKVRSVAETTAEVLVTGESGSGTPKVAEVIHLLSPFARKPFVKKAAGLLDVAGLLDAVKAAQGGTLFIDEIASLGGEAQYALLDGLENCLGARVIAGSTTPLNDAVAAGKFSADLFYRLDLMRVTIPPLRDRPSDIPVLFRHYVAQACEQAGLQQPEITADVVADLMAARWPGNTRALMNHAMRFALGLQDETVEDVGLVARLTRFEKSLLVEALQRSGGRAGDAAQALKLPRKTFYDKLAKHGVKPEDYRA